MKPALDLEHISSNCSVIITPPVLASEDKHLLLIEINGAIHEGARIAILFLIRTPRKSGFVRCELRWQAEYLIIYIPKSIVLIRSRTCGRQRSSTD
jgi:hypothetical protein